MTACRKLTALLVAAGLALALASGTAAANRSLSVEGTTQSLAGELTFAPREIGLTCRVTLTATLARSIAKVSGASVGRVTDARTRCLEGFTFTPQGLESTRLWLITYQMFLGTLPHPTGYRWRLERMLWLYGVPTFGTGCLYTGTEDILESAEASGTLGALEMVGRSGSVRLLTTLGGICGRSTDMVINLTPQRTTRITLL